VDVGWPAFVRGRLTLGELYERLGERDAAARAYEQFLALWQGGDAAVEPQRRLARAGLARVRDASPGQPVPVR
jgi:predicted TPR repeat methyltransferase